MPFSSNSGKEHIRRIMERINPKTALDIGCGCGTYAKMFPELEWTGVEIWEPYVEKYGLRSLYKELHVADASEWTTSETFDVAILGDVLEHMSSYEALELFKRVSVYARTVIVSIPLGHYPQGEYEGNPYEAHVTDNWSDGEFVAVFGKPDWQAIDNEIGVYVYSPLLKQKPKIAVYAISKNETQFVERFCTSAKDADLILIADTGSTDDTVQNALDNGAVVPSMCITPWRFDLARNAALALIPRDIDICISLDLDEELQPGWREEIERVWVLGETTRLRYLFDWGCGIAFYYEKIHARHGYMWHHPCHEYPIPDGRIVENWAQSDMLLVVHKPDPTKSRGQYLDLLELSVKEDPDCPRNAFYYARELSFHAKWREAIAACETYLALPRATWANERAYAYRVMGRSYKELGEHWQAEIAFQTGCIEAPGTREPWADLADLFYVQARWPECYAAAMRGLGIVNREQVYTVDPEVWGYKLHDLAAISAWNMGLVSEARKHGAAALEHAPNDLRLIDNMRWFAGKAAA